MTVSLECSCALCSLPVQGKGIQEEDLAFCCRGCQVVYQILAKQGTLEEYDKSPLFTQAVKSGLISNPDLLQKLKKKSDEKWNGETKKLHLEIENLWCPSCAEVIRLVLLTTKGVTKAVCDYATDIALIEFDPKEISEQSILQTIKKMGYRPRSLEDGDDEKKRSFLLLWLLVASFCSFNIMMLSYPVYASYFDQDFSGLVDLFTILAFVFALPVITFCAFPIYQRCWHALKVGIFGMEALVVMGSGSAFFLSTYNVLIGDHQIYFDSMSVIITFVLLGKIIENRAKFSAKESLMRLTRSLPKKGRRLSGEFVPLKEISTGDHLIAYTGEKIVLDGIVSEGEGAVDESIVTGESIPKRKNKGKKVVSGSIVQSGWVSYCVTATLKKSTLHEIIQMIEKELLHKKDHVRITDRIVYWFVPFVFSCALLSSFFSSEGTLVRFLSVLLIACPCSLGIATPLVEARWMHALALNGMIVRSRASLLTMNHISTFVFDKTGTCTEGNFTLLGGVEKLKLFQKQVLATLSSFSTHPIAVAISTSLDFKKVEMGQIEEIPGKGMQGVYQGKTYFVGSPSFMKIKGISFIDEPPDVEFPITTVFFADESSLLAKIKLGDRIREETAAVVKALGPKKCYLVSGDVSTTVSIVARECGIPRFEAEKEPLQKCDMIQSLQREGKKVCFIGDGVNDAPALAASNLGVSVSSATDFSIEASDVHLTAENLSPLPKMIKMAQKGQRLIRQNLFWAFGYNVVGIGLAAFGFLSPLYSASIMVLSSIIVLVNAQRMQ